MNILVLIHNQEGSGVFGKVIELCKAYSTIGHSVTLFCTSSNLRFRGRWVHDESLIIYSSPDIFSGRARQGIDPWNVFHRLRAICKNNYDIVHAIDCRPNVIIPALFCKYRQKIPLIISWWDLFGDGGTASERSGKLYNITLGKIEFFFEMYFRKYANYSVVVSSFLKKKLIDLGLKENKIKVLKVGCKINQFNKIEKSEARKILKIEDKQIVYCFAGTIFYRDLNLLLESLIVLKSKTTEMPTTILIGEYNVSSDTCARLNIRLIKKIANLRDVYVYFNASDYGLLPFLMSIANNARWPSKISDYMAAGLPLIATPFGDMPEIFKRYNIGILSESDSIYDYSEALNKGIQVKKEEYESTIVGVRKFMHTELDWEVIAKETLRINESLTN